MKTSTYHLCFLRSFQRSYRETQIDEPFAEGLLFRVLETTENQTRPDPHIHTWFWDVTAATCYLDPDRNLANAAIGSLSSIGGFRAEKDMCLRYDYLDKPVRDTLFVRCCCRPLRMVYCTVSQPLSGIVLILTLLSWGARQHGQLSRFNFSSKLCGTPVCVQAVAVGTRIGHIPIIPIYIADLLV